MADDVPLGSLLDAIAARGPRVPLASLTASAREPIDWTQLQLPSDVGFDQQGTPMRVSGSDVMNLVPMIQQGVEAGGRIVSDPRAFLRGEAPLENPLANPTATGEDVGLMMGAIKAYHGSPHDFDKFDISKIGTGEGAQAFGHGLYFAENEDVAMGYRKALATKTIQNEAEGRAAIALRQYGSREKAAKILNSDADRWDKSREPGAKDRALVYRNSAKLLESEWQPPQGKLYQVSINADPAHFLDWDKPLSEQSEHVRNALGYNNFQRDFDLEARLKPGSPEYEDYVRKMDARVGAPGNPDVKGADYYRSDLLRSGEHDERDMSQKLREAGIPGIRYLDQGSRAAGEGSRNYVVFDDALVDILKKYGVAGLAALPALQGVASGHVPLSTLPQQQ